MEASMLRREVLGPPLAGLVGVWRSEVGKFYCGGRSEQRKVSRSTGIRGDARQGESGGYFRPGGFSSEREGFDSCEFGIHAIVVPDPRFERRGECNGVERLSGE